MPRLPRLQYENAIYHVVTRGDGRRRLFHNEGHYKRFTKGLQEQVDRCGGQVIAYCWMPNHIHGLIRTPQPNLACGMQHWLSGYANWYAKRNRRTGHLYQGRYKAFPVEDEGYYWNLSRYIHLNPCNGGKPLAESPERYPHSSYAGYARKTRRVDWIDYDQHNRYWKARHGGDPQSAYRQFVKAGMLNPVDPTVDRLKDWVYGGERSFCERWFNWQTVKTNQPAYGRASASQSTLSMRSLRQRRESTGLNQTTIGDFAVMHLAATWRPICVAAIRPQRWRSCRVPLACLTATVRGIWSNALGVPASRIPRYDRRISKIEKHLSLNPESRV